MTPRSGTLEPANLVSRGAAYGDFDNDGGVDIVVINRDGPPQMLRNIVDDRGNWVKFRVLDPSGRDAHGATVTLKSGDKSWTTVVHTDGSYCAASDPRVHFGIGAIDTVDEVEVLCRMVVGSDSVPSRSIVYRCFEAATRLERISFWVPNDRHFMDRF